MNPRILLLLMLLAACNGGASTPSAAPPLEGARIGGPFALVDGQRRIVRDSDFAGRWRIVYFGYTFCPDVCPVDLQRLAAGLRRVEKDAPEVGARVVPIFITVDPERDTPAAIGRYVAAFHPRMVGLTGSPMQIAAVARAYGVAFGKVETPGSSDYLMSHSNQAYLMDPDGKPVALLPHDAGPDAVAAEIRKWVR